MDAKKQMESADNDELPAGVNSRPTVDEDETTEPKSKVPKLDVPGEGEGENGGNADEVDNDEEEGDNDNLDDDDDDEDDLEVAMNPKFTDPEVFERLQRSWTGSVNLSDDKAGIDFYGEPFRVCVLQDFLSDKKVTGVLVNEMEEDVDWSHKQMDLYEFDQTTDLSNIQTMYLRKFLDMLKKSVQPWLEKLCNIKLTSVSASCSMYNCGDYLLVHDDLLKDRQIAFIYYMSPWEEVDKWTDEMGGCLEIFNTDENCFPHFPIVRKINPRNNQFAFFKVGSKSFHQVGEVTTSEYPRMTINGWFHGELNNDTVEDSLRPLTKMLFTSPNPRSVELESIINETYLKQESKQRIQKHIEDNSEICLEQFLQPCVFTKICLELKTKESLVWTIKGPANGQRYEILNLESATPEVAKLIDTFRSRQMFQLLQTYTDLDLDEPHAKEPSVCLEMQRWTPGCYTVLGDSTECDESALDLVFFMNTSEDVGSITYLTPEEENDSDYDESVLLTIKPKDNALNIVYRCEGTTKFTKYVSKLTPMERGPVYVLCCSYKE